MSVELLPDMPEPDFTDLGLEKLVAEVPDEDVDKAVERIAEQQRKTEPVERPAATGDHRRRRCRRPRRRRRDPRQPRRGPADRAGRRGLLPGFADQLVGANAGEARMFGSLSPRNTAMPDLAGKDGGVRGRRQGGARSACRPTIDDELAKAVGLENLAELRQEIRAADAARL